MFGVSSLLVSNFVCFLFVCCFHVLAVLLVFNPCLKQLINLYSYEKLAFEDVEDV